jgi:predicted metalloprotease with PDZ domain
MLQDGAYGALEHTNSVTVGTPSSDLAKDITVYLSEISHEFFHTWNLMRIRPAEFGDVTYKTPPLSRGLWWSEGLTLFYADLLMRRAGLHTFDSTRKTHLEGLLIRYFGTPGNMLISPEKVSLASDGPPGMLGDYSASTHLQGELIGTMLDLIIRDATNGKHSIDDVMRKMLERFSGEHGFTGRDIEKIATSVCGCDLHPFFKNFVSGNKTIEFERYLKLLGLHSTISWTEYLDEQGKPVPDFRVYAWQPPYENIPRLGITDPSTGEWKTNVLISGYMQPSVHLSEMPVTTGKQRKLYADWISGN